MSYARLFSEVLERSSPRSLEKLREVLRHRRSGDEDKDPLRQLLHALLEAPACLHHNIRAAWGVLVEEVGPGAFNMPGGLSAAATSRLRGADPWLIVELGRAGLELHAEYLIHDLVPGYYRGRELVYVGRGAMLRFAAAVDLPWVSEPVATCILATVDDRLRMIADMDRCGAAELAELRRAEIEPWLSRLRGHVQWGSPCRAAWIGAAVRASWARRGFSAADAAFLVAAPVWEAPKLKHGRLTRRPPQHEHGLLKPKAALRYVPGARRPLALERLRRKLRRWRAEGPWPVHEDPLLRLLCALLEAPASQRLNVRAAWGVIVKEGGLGAVGMPGFRSLSACATLHLLSADPWLITELIRAGLEVFAEYLVHDLAPGAERLVRGNPGSLRALAPYWRGDFDRFAVAVDLPWVPAHVAADMLVAVDSWLRQTAELGARFEELVVQRRTQLEPWFSRLRGHVQWGSPCRAAWIGAAVRVAWARR